MTIINKIENLNLSEYYYFIGEKIMLIFIFSSVIIYVKVVEN
jgi:hypothetical protein